MQNQISKEHSRSAGKPQPPEMINPANRNGRAEPRPSIPGGGIPMGASTQDTSKLPDSPVNFNNSGGSNDR